MSTKLDVYNEFELYRMFGIWNSTICEISSLIQMAGNHRSTVIKDKVYKAFFHCDDYFHLANRPDQVLHSTIILALDIKFEMALHQQDEGYDTDNIYDVPQLFKRTACIHVVITTNEGPIDPWGSQGVQYLLPHQLWQEEQQNPCFTDWLRNI